MRSPQEGSSPSGRTLYHFPIIHTQVDMGGLAEKVRRSTIQQLGQEVWRRNLRIVDKIWSRIERFLDELQLSFGKVRLYQDGLPVCGREADIVRDLALQGSRNYRLLLRLMGKGATIMGTESPEFLVEEYRQARRALAGEAGAGEIAQKELLQKRDRFIARRINDTLLADEAGILFLGMLHTLDGLLDEDIRVISVAPFNNTKKGQKHE